MCPGAKALRMKNIVVSFSFFVKEKLNLMKINWLWKSAMVSTRHGDLMIMFSDLFPWWEKWQRWFVFSSTLDMTLASSFYSAYNEIF